MAVILIVEDEEQVPVLADSFLQAEGNKTLSWGGPSAMEPNIGCAVKSRDLKG